MTFPLIYFFGYALLRQNSHTIKLTLLQWIIQWHLAHSQCYATIPSTDRVPKHSLAPKGKPASTQQSSPPLGSQSLLISPPSSPCNNHGSAFSVSGDLLVLDIHLSLYFKNVFNCCFCFFPVIHRACVFLWATCTARSFGKNSEIAMLGANVSSCWKKAPTG